MLEYVVGLGQLVEEEGTYEGPATEAATQRDDALASRALTTHPVREEDRNNGTSCDDDP